MSVAPNKLFYLMADQTTNGNGTGSKSIQLSDPECECLIWGTLGGGTITLECSPVDGVWLSVPASDGTAFSATAAGVYPGLDVTNGDTLRAVLTGASGSFNVNVAIRQVKAQ